MKRVLVTGGAGFIGLHVVNNLVKEGYDVLVIDNLITGKIENIRPEATFIKVDICSSELSYLFQSFKPDVVIHLAAQSSVNFSIKIPKLDAEINIIGTLNILQLSKEYKVNQIIFTSTAAVYGNPLYSPITEESLLSPLSPYGLSKMSCEKYIQLYQSLYGLPYTILRLSNVYGPGQNHKGESGVISIFIEKMLNNETPVIFGDGKQIRDFIYVEDVANAIVKAIQNKNKNGIFNISSGIGININGIYELISQKIGYKNEPKYVSKKEGDILESVLDNHKALTTLSWYPKTNIENGIEKTIQYMEKCIALTY